ncbi:MAG: Holliday junction branch migration protein RuvA [Anaerovoracaceae bacterium]|jgi:Holliday junction DNA helicase RuvA
MFHYIRGRMAMKLEGGIVLDVNGIGYEILVPDNSSVYLTNTDETVLLYTAMIVREDDISIYGFPEKETLGLFRKLMTVTGIGAKAAMAILSSMPANEVIKAILYEDVTSLTKANGVGKKTAQRLILELKDKLSDFDVLEESPVMVADAGSERIEALNGLMSLGFSKSEALDALAGVKDENLTTEEYIKQALKR